MLFCDGNEADDAPEFLSGAWDKVAEVSGKKNQHSIPLRTFLALLGPATSRLSDNPFPRMLEGRFTTLTNCTRH